MLTITIPGQEFWDEKKEEFIQTKGVTIQLEHSLISLSKWESKWHKPFLGRDDRTDEETLDYIRCMTITPNVDPKVYELIDNKAVDEISEYIKDSMTATWFSNRNGEETKKEVITSEIIYYAMIINGIPFECQKWHLNRLLTLIQVCNEKNKPQKKRSTKEIAREQAAINAARRKALHSKG